MRRAEKYFKKDFAFSAQRFTTVPGRQIENLPPGILIGSSRQG